MSAVALSAKLKPKLQRPDDLPFPLINEVLAKEKAFEVEFSDRNGRTYESLGLRPEQIMVAF